MKMTEKIKMAGYSAAAFATLGATALLSPVVKADSPASQYTDGGSANSEVGSYNLMDTLQVIINVALGLIGFVAVVMIIFGGVQYTTSSGDATKVTKAKNTILYGVVGLVIALLAFAIVNFILDNIFG